MDVLTADRKPAPRGRGPLLALRLAERRPTLALAPFLLVYLAVPLLAPSSSNLYDDEAGYVGLAKYLVAGHYLSGRDDLVGGGPAYPNLWFGPGLPLVLSPFVAAGVPVDALRLLGPLFLFAAVLLFHRLLLLFVPARAALLGALALALYVPLYTVIAFLHSEALALPLAVGALYATTLYLRGGRVLHLAAAGAALAGLAVTRIAFGWVVTALLLAFLAGWAATRRPSLRRLAAVYAVGLALCVPWLTYTYGVTGKVFYWGSSGPLSLYWLTSPYPGDTGDWHGADSVFRDPRLSPHRAFFRSLAGLDLNEQNRRLEHRALANVEHHPLAVAGNVADNVSRLLFNVPYSFKPAKPSGLVYSLPAGALLLALLASAVRAARRRARLPAETTAFVALGAAAFALHAVLAGYPRLLFPVVPVALWLVVVCWSRPAPGGADA